MYKNIATKIFICCAWTMILFLASCSAEKGESPILPEPPVAEADSLGTLELRLESTNNTRATTTVISKAEAENFLITIYKGTDVYRETAKLKDINTRLSAGYGYTVKAENCTETDAETSNEQWGQKRFAGFSEPFAIKAGEITKVGIGCSVANAGVEVIFDETVPHHFTDSYQVTISGNGRPIIFDEETGGKKESGNIIAGDVAYFNVDKDGKRVVTYKIEAYGPGKRLVKSNTVELAKATISRLTLTFIPGTLDLDIAVEQENLFLNKDIEITDQDVIQDDGSTDINGEHDSFDEEDGDVDISDYDQI